MPSSSRVFETTTPMTSDGETPDVAVRAGVDVSNNEQAAALRRESIDAAASHGRPAWGELEHRPVDVPRVRSGIWPGGRPHKSTRPRFRKKTGPVLKKWSWTIFFLDTSRSRNVA
jgi:hypothetical protein